MLTWDELTELEPGLLTLQERIIRFENDHRRDPDWEPFFDWYGYPGAETRPGFKAILSSLVGWHRGEPIPPPQPVYSEAEWERRRYELEEVSDQGSVDLRTVDLPRRRADPSPLASMGAYSIAYQHLNNLLHGVRPKSAVHPTTRFDVLERDGFRCVYCGRSVSDGVKLEVDHVVPKSRGGTGDIRNLATACYDCNRGKRDRIIQR